MAANFWTSSHCTHWILDRRRVEDAMKEDLEYIDIDTLTKIKMWYYNIIGKIGKRLQFRQQVVATAIVYFKRFYTNIRSTDPSLVAATCIYLACKIEECPQHIKHIIQEMKHALASLGGFDYDMSKVAEFEFYLLEELEFYLIVYHPYRDLTLIAKDLKLEESNLQTAWFVLNDSYRTDVCLFYAPHMIALAALYIICVVHAEQYNDNNNSNNIGGGGSGHSVSSGGGSNAMDESGVLGHNNIHLAQINSSNSAANKTPGAGGGAGGTGGSQNTPTTPSSSTEGHGINNRNMVQWFADLNVDIEEIIEITQEILSLYSIWKDYEEEHVPAMMQALKMYSEPTTPQHQIMQ
ncbi:hypothetical protein BGZ96_011736 [Linnemannia gamsii]|uniref:Cyclin-like domain-containing protein n=1 Tax=Linnemannia gamsii TaxID=64522 RepID=A0ABQ7JSC5_9FUNG|nr:hypothetical protein BGZ96_011736 [Linnemannia gamsii]